MPENPVKRSRFARIRELPKSRRVRRIAISLVIAIVVYALLGFVGVPMLLYHLAANQGTAALHRQVSLGHAYFNPFRLLLELDKLHVAERSGSDRFVDVGHLHVKVSWSSLYRLAPIVTEVSVGEPDINIVRNADKTFNFSDLTAPSGQPTPEPKPESKPMRFAVSNIQIANGRIGFDDKLLNNKHVVDKIQLNVPFIANLPADVDIFVQPLLQMVVDGSPLRIAGKAKPFANPPESEIDLKLDRLDLPSYAAYLPPSIPIKLPKGALTVGVGVHFVSEPEKPLIRTSGTASIDDLDIRDEANSPLLSVNHFGVDLADVEPLNQVVHLEKISVDGLAAVLVRNADGTTNLTPLMGGKAASGGTHPPSAQAPQSTPASTPVQASATAASTATASPIARSTSAASPVASNGAPQTQSQMTAAAISSPVASSPKATVPAPSASGAIASPSAQATSSAAQSMSLTTSNSPPPASGAPSAPVAASAAQNQTLDLTLNAFELKNSSVKLTDNSGPTPSVLSLEGIQIDLGRFQLGGKAPTTYDFSTRLGGGGTIAVKGALDLPGSRVTSNVTLDQIDLAALQSFAQAVLAGHLQSGKLVAHASVRTDFAPGKFNVHAEPADVALDGFDLRAPGKNEAPVAWKEIKASIAQVDLAAHQADVKEFRVDGLKASIERGKKGELNLESLIRQSAAPPPPPPPKRVTVARHTRAARGRRAKTEENESEKTKSETKPPGVEWKYRVALFAIENSDVRVRDESTPKPVMIAVAPLNIHVRDVSNDLHKPIKVDVAATVNRKGSINVGGVVTPEPLKAELRVATKRLDLAIANPYLSSHLNAAITSAVLTMNASLGLAQMRREFEINFRGDTTLGNVRVLDKLTGEDFVRWSSFSANRINLSVGGREPKVHIGALALSNFYARIILNADGQLNVNDIIANPQQAPTSLTRAHQTAGAHTPAPTIVPTPSATPTPIAPGAGQPSPPTEPVAGAGKPVPANIEIGGITLQDGHVNYSDNFIKPNYSADLTEIGGKIGAFGTSSTTPADVLLEGEVNGNSPIKISGSINPLTPMAFVDIKANADKIELTNLTPYSTKYTGYPIDKGTLTLDVHYVLDQGKLTAENHISIDQLTFGDKVENSTAVNLPIRLAVALLKDSNGVIDLRLPVSGSLNDPQFSIGGVIWQVLRNLILKAATSPFTLLASAVHGVAGGGGGADLSYIEFKPGYANLTQDDQNKLTTVAKALHDRPALTLKVVGHVDPKVDHDGLRYAKVDRLVRAQKAKDEGKEAGKDLASVEVMPDEYDKYLKRVYKAATFEKPKDFVGLNKSLPSDEMKKLLVTNMQVTDKDLQELANARAVAVRDSLVKKVEPSRVTIGAPKLDAKGIEDKGKTSRAELVLQ